MNNFVVQLKQLSSVPWLVWLAALMALFIWQADTLIHSLVYCALYAVSLLVLMRLNLKHGATRTSIWLNTLPYLLDLLFYTALFSLYGGAANGAVIAFIIPCVLAAILQKTHESWLICLTAILCYSALMVIGHAEHIEHFSADFIEHLIGMWLTFVFSICLITGFLSYQQQSIRIQNRTISQFKERQLRDEQILAVATSAANSAHALATPLSTANLLVEELKMDFEHPSLLLLQEQLSLCSTAVYKIADQARMQKSQDAKWQVLEDFILQTIEYWWTSQNEINYKVNMPSNVKSLLLLTDFNLQMSLINVLQNAAYASLHNGHHDIEISLIQNNKFIDIVVDDFGQGISEELLIQLGQTYVDSQKQLGMGIGLALANASIERLGGHLNIQNRIDGARSIIQLPVKDEHE